MWTLFVFAKSTINIMRDILKEFIFMESINEITKASDAMYQSINNTIDSAIGLVEAGFGQVAIEELKHLTDLLAAHKKFTTNALEFYINRKQTRIKKD